MIGINLVLFYEREQTNAKLKSIVNKSLNFEQYYTYKE